MGSALGWFYLFIAGVLEIGFTTALRYSEGFTKLVPTTLVLILAVVSFYFVARSTETIPLGTACARVWSASAPPARCSSAFMRFRSLSRCRASCLIGVIIAAVVGLKLVSE